MKMFKICTLRQILGWSEKMRVLRLSLRWCFKSGSSGLWRRVVLWQDANVSEVHTASVNEDGGSVDLWNVGILPQRYTVSKPRRPQLRKKMSQERHVARTYEMRNAHIFFFLGKPGGKRPLGRTRHACEDSVTRVCPKVSGLAAWNENCKWYSSLALAVIVSLFCESV